MAQVGNSAEERLRIVQQQLQLLSDLTQAGIWWRDAKSNELVLSDTCSKLFGFAAGTALSYDNFLHALHPDDRQRVDEALTLALQNGTSYYSEFRVVWPDGSIHWLVTKADIERDATGAPVRMQGVSIDSTERKAMETQLLQLTADAFRASELQTKLAALRKEMLAREKMANKELEAFSYSAAHDLRAPLMVIEGFASLLLEEWADRLDDAARSKLNIIISNVNRMRQLIVDLLALSKVERQELQIKDTAIGDLVTEIFQELSNLCPERKIDFRVGPLPNAQADEGLLRQVLTNFLSNAIKFTRGKDPACIEVGSKQEGSECVYFVKDNGAGFDMHNAQKLFFAFQRLHTQDQFEGTGIGLTIVKRIIARHGGRVWVESKVDEGTTFYFTLSPGEEENNEK
ncbi:MAG: PAS domain-containing protein [Candidatus Omnitrophica bacterium]|nr:PAS domain-containing protein [Candidatus Omnitrophota bacterium]